MLYILIALLGITVIAIWGTTKGYGFFHECVCPLIAILGFCGLSTYSALAYDYFAAEYKANIINREYGTNYTQIEVFYASDVIDTIRNLDRKRIELNGDLMDKK